MSVEPTSAWLFDSLLITTILMAAILVIRRPVARSFGPGIAYALWLLPAARLFMPSLTGPAIEKSLQSGSVSDAVRDAVIANVQNPSPVNAAGELAATASIDWIALLITVWLGGAAIFFLIQMLRYASMRDELLCDAEEVGNIDGIRLVQSDRVGGPLAFGLFRRFIAVPVDFTKAYTPAERDLAIAHELAHHKSGDLFANVAAFIVLCLQWFNPVAWMSWNAFRFDQEAACDARVLAGKGSDERQAYGRALARAACDGVPAFATALNSPKTIIERLRRLTMQDASKGRRSLGKLGILAAAAIILPLTATVVPAISKAADESDAPKVEKHKVKIVKIKDGDNMTVVHEGEGNFTKKIERDGKTFVFHTDKELSDAEVESMIAKAEASRAEAEAARQVAEEAQGQAEVARAEAEKARIIAFRQIEGMNPSAFIPDIDIKEITKNCNEGQPVTTDVQGFDGQSKSKVRIVMCGKGQAKLARAEAINGLKEARDDIADDEDMPEKVRKDVMAKLDEQIKKMESEID